MSEMYDFFKLHSDIYLIFVAALSLLVGSFLNVLIYRLPKIMRNEWNEECRSYLGLKAPSIPTERLNLFLPFSHCIGCKQSLMPWHNIPLISYLILKGKCSYCETGISLRYPLVELLCCLASVYVAWRFNMSWSTCGGLIFTWILLGLTFIDLDWQILPDDLTYLLLWIGLFLSIFNIFVSSHEAIIGAIAGYLIFAIISFLFKALTGKVGMGQGDFKLLAALGAYLGWMQLPIIILLASFIGMMFGLIPMLINRQFRSVPIPFGPSLAIAGWISMMWGSEIIHWYSHSFLHL